MLTPPERQIHERPVAANYFKSICVNPLLDRTNKRDTSHLSLKANLDDLFDLCLSTEGKQGLRYLLPFTHVHIFVALA